MNAINKVSWNNQNQNKKQEQKQTKSKKKKEDKKNQDFDVYFNDKPYTTKEDTKETLNFRV